MRVNDTADNLFILLLCCLSWLIAITCGVFIGSFMQRAVAELGAWLNWLAMWLRV